MPPSVPTTPSKELTDIADTGWRTEDVTQADGTIVSVRVPLTALEFLHPQEGYRLPNSTFHEDVAGGAKELLSRRYASNPDVAAFRDLIIKWDITELGDHCPDTFVVFGLRNKEQNRTNFTVAEEGVRPALIKDLAQQQAQEMATLLARYQKQFGLPNNDNANTTSDGTD